MIKEVAAMWDEMALRLHFEANDIARIERDHHWQSVQAARVVFSEWLEGKGRQPKTWHTLIAALDEMGFQDISNDLEIIFDVSDIV